VGADEVDPVSLLDRLQPQRHRQVRLANSRRTSSRMLAASAAKERVARFLTCCGSMEGWKRKSNSSSVFRREDGPSGSA
jgi:hypothetical protein